MVMAAGTVLLHTGVQKIIFLKIELDKVVGKVTEGPQDSQILYNDKRIPFYRYRIV